MATQSQTGTHTISDLLAVRYASAITYGLDTIQKVLTEDLAMHNATVNTMVSELAEFTTDNARIYGTSVSGRMQKVDEFGRTATRKVTSGGTVAFPLWKFQDAIGWTADYFQVATPADMAATQVSVQHGHLTTVQNEVAKALFESANYTFNDFLINEVALPVKRLINADGSLIPDGLNGETFDGSTHTHYLARAGGSLAATDVTALINHVVEHGHGEGVRIYINRADEATFRALTGFQAYVDPRIMYRVTDTPASSLDITRVDNRAIGIFGAAEVWTKTWVPANYFFCFAAGSPNKPLCFRQRSQSTLQGLRIVPRMTEYPLYADFYEAYYGVGVWTRTNGAVLYTGGTNYVDPTIG